jgi:hypothetical protein
MANGLAQEFPGDFAIDIAGLVASKTTPSARVEIAS